MSAACLIVCERQSRFGPLLRRALSDRALEQRPRVVETRSAIQCERALEESPASLVALEVTPANLAAALDLLVRASGTQPAANFAALLPLDLDSQDGSRGQADRELMAAALREAGAIDVFHSALEAPRLARLASRHSAVAPREEQSFRESVWQRLPWKAYATSG